MSKIEEMIMELCPNGVEWKKLGEVCEIIVGGDIPNNTKKGFGFDGEHCYPIYSNGVGQNSLYGFTDSYRIAKEAVTISARGTIGWHCVRKPYFTPIVRLITLVPHDVIVVKYLDAVLDVVNIEGSKGGIPQLTVPNVKNIQIPLPPLPIQEEIVRILDKFVEQQEQLEQLIELRKKQYEYYREELLTPKEGEEWETKTLGGIFEMRNGYTPSKSNLEFWSDGDIPWFRMEDIREKGRYLSDSSLHITDKAIRGKGLFKKNTLILSTSATIGEHALLMIDALANQRFTNLKIKNAFENKVDIEYMYYYMFIVDAFCKEHTNKSGFESVDMVALKNMDIHFPNLAKQREIVTILQKSEVSINSLMDVLESCKDRNTHYRDQLLRF